MIFLTGDTHGDFTRFSTDIFPEQKQMTKDDFVIVCGDFGLWHGTKQERHWLDWLNDKPFTTLFVDGNHENFDRLYQMPVSDWTGGQVHFIRDSVIHLMRGHVFDIAGKRVFAMGGASSHDITAGNWNRMIRTSRASGKLWISGRLFTESTMFPGGKRNCQATQNTKPPGAIWTPAAGRSTISSPTAALPASRISSAAGCTSTIG